MPKGDVGSIGSPLIEAEIADDSDAPQLDRAARQRLKTLLDLALSVGKREGLLQDETRRESP